MALVEVRGLVKDFPTHRPMSEALRHPFDHPQVRVLDGIDLTLEPGQIVGVLGANGAGKTTMLKVIATLVAPTSGSVTINGWEVETHLRNAKDIVSYCNSEERSFYWRLTGRQNLEFFAALNALHGQAARRTIDQLAERLAIDAYLELPFSRFSSGIRQRFALARSLLASPRVLLLDEPTRSIDPVEARSIWSWIRDDLVDEEGIAVILVTHQVAEAIALCDRVGVLTGGTIEGMVLPGELERITAGLRGLTLTLEGLEATELPRLRSLRGIRDVAFSERNGQQHLEVWCDDCDEALTDLVALTTSAGARVRAFERGATIPAILAPAVAGRNGNGR